MTTEITSQLPPCPLPDCEGGEGGDHHFHDVEAYAAENDKTHDCATHARDGFRCYGPHVKDQPGTQWQPIEHDQIKAGMRIRATIHRGDLTTIHIGVAHHNPVGTRVWFTEGRWLLDGWGDSTYEVDPATIPDPDAELIELIGKAIYDADESADEWGNEWGEAGTEDAYRKLARAALTVIRESEVEA